MLSVPITATSSSQDTRRESAPFRWLDLLVTASFVALFLIQLVHHNVWRDELNAFGIVLDSPTLASLLDHLHFEGHPWLWYVILWGASHLTTSPVIGLKVVEGLLGTSILLLLGLRSPFSLPEKVLLFTSYFLSFEYIVLARMYSVVVLLLILYLRDRTLRPSATLLKAVLLGLMGCADTLGLMLSAALILELLLSQSASTLRHCVSSGAVYLILIASAIASAHLSADISWRTTARPFDFARDPGHLLQAAIRYVVLPWLPVRSMFSGYFWNPAAPTHHLFFAVLLLLVVAAYFFLFRGSRNLLALMAAAIIMAVAFGHLIYAGWMRHYGVTFLAFLACLWILRARDHRLPRLAIALLILNSLAGLTAAFGQWRRPFSNAQNAAGWLQAQHLDHAPIAGTPDTSLASIAEILHRPVYFLDCNCSDTYLLFSKRRDTFQESEIPARLRLAGQALHTPDFLFLDAAPLEPQYLTAIRDQGQSVTLLQSFTGAESFGEDFYIYRIDSRNAPSLASTGENQP